MPKTNTAAIMEQAQVYASSWSMVGGRFDSGACLEQAGQEKDELRAMVDRQQGRLDELLSLAKRTQSYLCQAGVEPAKDSNNPLEGLLFTLDAVIAKNDS